MEETQKSNSVPASILIGALIIGGAVFLKDGGKAEAPRPRDEAAAPTSRVSSSLPESITIPVRWGSVRQDLVASGVIDTQAFERLYRGRGDLDLAIETLSGKSDGEIVMTRENAGILLNIFWALGLGQKSDVLTSGPMSDVRYGGPDRFASTAGWTIARGSSMNHFSRHSFLDLTSEEESLVERVAKGIYRPCCDNPTHFPDCNHGMAMLGLLELLASEGASEDEMFRIAAAVNAMWFPDEYETIARYLKGRGRAFSAVDPREIVGKDYASASGYQRILAAAVTPEVESGGGGCGV